MNIEEFNKKCCSILKNIKKDDGLNDYYLKRINNKKILSWDEDELLIKYFKENIDKNSNILEIGAGIGQVSHFLNKNGFTNITINEFDKKRFKLAEYLNNQLNNNCNLVFSQYQKMQLSDYDYVFCINGKTTWMGSPKYLPIFEKILNQGVKVFLFENSLGETKQSALKCNEYLKSKEPHYLNSLTEFTNKLIEKYSYKIIGNNCHKEKLYLIYKDYNLTQLEKSL